MLLVLLLNQGDCNSEKLTYTKSKQLLTGKAELPYVWFQHRCFLFLCNVLKGVWTAVHKRGSTDGQRMTENMFKVTNIQIDLDLNDSQLSCLFPFKKIFSVSIKLWWNWNKHWLVFKLIKSLHNFWKALSVMYIKNHRHYHLFDPVIPIPVRSFQEIIKRWIIYPQRCLI